MLMGSFPRKTRCCLSTLMTSRSSVISLTVRVLGTLTSIPDCSTGAVTMKIISSTRTTSTSGVTLMSEIEDCVRPLEAVKAITFAPPEPQAATAPQRSASPAQNHHPAPQTPEWNSPASCTQSLQESPPPIPPQL